MYETKYTEGFCRACLVKYEDPLDLIQYSERNRRFFIYITGLQVKRNDPFIFQLCKDCFSLLRTAGHFKKKCRTADKRFRSFVGLRNAGEDIDFCSFLKNNDDSHTFRLPFMSGNSTPAFHKTKDDDNVSTCTSIRNFMTDMLKEDEIPDTEARIIKEVIEEEADISEDSLDSQWLQDEMSINGDLSTLDFRMDSFTKWQWRLAHSMFLTSVLIAPVYHISLKDGRRRATDDIIVYDSPFSTPKVDNTDHYQSPKPDLCPVESAVYKGDSCDAAIKLLSLTDNVIEIPEIPKSALNYYTAKEEVPVKCSIDKKLNLALKDEDNQSFSLDDLLKSPAALRGLQLTGVATPTINNILFGKTLDTEAAEITTKKEPDLEILANESQDNSFALSDFSFGIPDVEESEEIEIVIEKHTPEYITTSCDIRNLYCKLCDKKLKSYCGLVQHFRLTHNYIIPAKKNENKVFICDSCGRTTKNRTNLIKHLKTHEKKVTPTFACPICALKFVGKHILKTHMLSHETLEDRANKTKSEAKFICPVCGKQLSSRQNFSTHKLRHGEDFKFICDICRIGFFRKYDFNVHMRTHTGEKPHVCDICHMKFSRVDTLNRHFKQHLDTAPFKCEHCGKKYVTNSTLKTHIATSIKCQNIRISKCTDSVPTISEKPTL